MPRRPDRLRPPPHRHALRQGPDELPAQPAGARLSRRGAVAAIRRARDRLRRSEIRRAAEPRRIDMDISLLHAGLAAGAALAAVPVILHLFMRQTPKHVIFPALRLIRERQKRSKKRLRVKNWLLLLARMALVALMALALARPGLSLAGRRWATRRSPRRSAWSSTPACRWATTEQGQDPARRGQGARRRDPQEDCPTRARSSWSTRPSRACRSRSRRPRPGSGSRAWSLRAANRPLNAAVGPGLRGGRRERPAAPRGLRPDRPGPLGLGPRPAGRGAGQGSRRSSRASPPTSCG